MREGAERGAKSNEHRDRESSQGDRLVDVRADTFKLLDTLASDHSGVADDSLAELRRLDDEEDALSPFARAVRDDVTLFLTSILDWFDAKASSSVSIEPGVHESAFMLYSNFFNRHPGLESSLALEERLIFMARATRNRILSPHIGGSLVGNFVYDLAFTEHAELLPVVDHVLAQDLAIQLDVINQLATVGGVAAGQAYDTDRAIHNASWLIRSIIMNHQAAIVEIAGRRAVETIDREQEEPQNRTIRRLGQTSGSRLHSRAHSTRFLEHHEALRRQIRTTPQLPQGHHFCPMSPEIIVVYDQSDMPVAYAHARSEQLPQSFGVLPESLDFFEKMFSDPSVSRRLTPHGKVHYFHEFMSDVLLPHYLGGWDPIERPIDPKQALEIVIEALPGFASVWRRLLTEIAPGKGYPDEDSIGSPNLTQQWNAFRVAAKKKVDEIRATVVEYRPELTLHPIEALSADPIVRDLVGDTSREELLLLRHVHNPTILFEIQDKIRIALGNMPIAVQMPFIRYLTQQSSGDLARIGRIFEKTDANKSDALLTSFLSCREDLANGEIVLRIADGLSPEQASEIFMRYAQIANEARTARSVLRTEFKGEATENQVRELADTYLRNANEILQKIDNVIQRHTTDDTLVANCKTLLERYSAEGQLLVSTYQYLRSESKVKTLSDVKGVMHDTVSLGAEGFDSFIAKCRALYKQNGATDALIEKFEQKARTPGAVIHRVMFKDTLISFMLQYPEGEGRVEFSALNARDELSETSVGTNLFADVLAQVLGQGKEVEFDALPDRYRQYEKILPRKLRAVPMQFATLREYDDVDDDYRPTFRARISMVKDSAK